MGTNQNKLGDLTDNFYIIMCESLATKVLVDIRFMFLSPLISRYADKKKSLMIERVVRPCKGVVGQPKEGGLTRKHGA